MSLDYRNLSCLAYANGFTIWHYKTNDTPQEVFQSHYFNLAKDMFAQGDSLTITADSWGGQFYLDLSNGEARLITYSYINLGNQPQPLPESSAPPEIETQPNLDQPLQS